MIGKKINQLATELAPVSTDLTIIGDPTTGVSKKITLAQLGAIFSGAVSFYTNLAAFPNPGTIDVIYCAKDTKKLYLWSGSAYVEVFPSQALLDTYQLRSEKGVSNGYASLDSGGKVPISQLPSSIMEYKGTWNAATNTPTLANGTGDTGDVYLCNVAGTVNFGAGAIAFAVGDYVIYSGSIWQRSSGAVGTVTSVAASITGDSISISGSPISTSGTLAFAFAGNSTQYVNGAGNLVTFPGIINEAQNLITEVYNKTGATLTKGTVVYINGGQGNLPTVTKALATGDSTSAQTYGIVRNDITNNNNGYVVVAGRISDLDTQAFTEGTQLYLSPTTAGTYTSTKPYAPQHLVYVGIVVRAHPTQGVIEVKIQNGYEMDELHNVAAQSPDNNDILQYKTATSLWTKVAGTTSNIAEGTNLYYTDARSRAAISLTTTGTSGAATYNNTTGVFNIPNYGSALTGFVPYTGATTSVNLGTNNITAQNYLLNGNGTTTGSYLAFKQYNSSNSGIDGHTSIYALAQTSLYIRYSQLDLTSRNVDLSAALLGTTARQYLFPDKNGTFAMLSDIPALTGYVTGSGTNNYIAKFTSTGSVIGNSQIIDNGTSVLIGASGSIPNVKVVINSTTQRALEVVSTNTNALFVQSPAASIMTISNGTWSSNFTNTGRLDLAGDLLINTIANATTDTDKFLVSDGGVVKYRTATEFISDIGGPYVSSVAALTIGTTGTDLSSTVANGTTTPVITLNVPTASATNRGALSSADWTTFNNKQNTLTNPVTGTGTTNYLPKFTGTSTIGDSAITDNGTTVSLVSRALSGTSASFTSNVTAYGNAATSSAINANNTAGSSGTAQYYQDFGNGAGFVAGRILRGNGASGLEANGLNIDNHTGFKVRLNQLGGSGGSFTIDGGNLGLGVTPSAWNGAYKVLQVGNRTSLVYANAGASYLGTNWYVSTGGFNTYIENSAATLYGQSAGQHQWFNAPSGTAGNAISFTQAMTLSASGNLSIGNTNDTYKLDVTGTGRFTGDVTVGASSQLYLTSGDLRYSSNAGFGIVSQNGNRLVSIQNGAFGVTGAATFSSSVTVNGDSSIFNGGTANNFNTYALGIANTKYLVFASTAASQAGGRNWSGGIGANASEDIFLGSFNNLSFGAGSLATRMTILGSNGNVGIGTTSPGGTLELLRANDSGVILRIGNAGSTYFDFSRSSSTGSLSIQGNQTGNNNILLAPTSGNVGIGLDNPNNRLEVTLPSGSNGQIIRMNRSAGAYGWAIGIDGSNSNFNFYNNGGTSVANINNSTGAYTATSDQRLKENILYSQAALDKVLQLKVRQYDWKNSGIKESYGFIAQELFDVLPQYVSKGNDTTNWGVAKAELVPMLVKAIQELKAELDTLKNK